MRFIRDQVLAVNPHFSQSPGLIERIDLALATTPILLALLLLAIVVTRLFPNHRKKALRMSIMTFWTFSWFARVRGQYLYDSPVGLMVFVVDMITLTLAIQFICRRFVSTPSVTQLITFGLAAIALFGTAVASFAFIIPTNTFIFSLSSTIFYLAGVYLLLKCDLSNQPLGPRSLVLSLGMFAFVSLPFLPYLFSPAPPDADITSMSEMIGYLYQGQSFRSIQTGVPNEWFSIRYPIGFPSLGWIFSHCLNVRSSEILLILWIASHYLLCFSLGELAEKIGGSRLAAILLSINPVLMGPHGLHGGQASKCLAYAMGVQCLVALISKKHLLAGVLLAGSIVISPVVTLPFLFVYGGFTLKSFIGSKSLKNHLPGLCFAWLSCLYVVFLDLGPKLSPSQPSILLNELTPSLFLRNIMKYAQQDSMGLWPIYIATGVILVSSRSFKVLALLGGWLAFALINDGFFGATHWSARFFSNYGTNGIWIVACAVLWKDIKLAIDERIPQYSRGAIIVIILLWFLWIKIPFPIKPESTFTTHSNINVSRFIETNLPKESLILNIRPPTADKSLKAREVANGFGFMVRGDSLRNTVHFRISDHHVLNGNIVSRVSYENCLAGPGDQLRVCLKDLGVTHLFLDARPDSRRLASSLSLKLIFNKGESFLFEI